MKEIIMKISEISHTHKKQTKKQKKTQKQIIDASVKYKTEIKSLFLLVFYLLSLLIFTTVSEYKRYSY